MSPPPQPGFEGPRAAAVAAPAIGLPVTQQPRPAFRDVIADAAPGPAQAGPPVIRIANDRLFHQRHAFRRPSGLEPLSAPVSVGGGYGCRYDRPLERVRRPRR